MTLKIQIKSFAAAAAAAMFSPLITNKE